MSQWVTVTREQLYDLVWQKPMARLAADYSISDVGLAKICARAGIPTPPRGYWARLEAGQALRKPRLQATANAPPIRIPLRSPGLDDGLSAQIAEEKKPEKRIVVPDRLQSPCELVEKAREALQVAKQGTTGFLERPSSCLDIRVSREQLARALRIADALLKALSERGWTVSVSGRKAIVVVEDVPLSLWIEEGTEADERPVKPDLKSSHYSFHYERRDLVHKPSGELSIAIREDPQLWGHSQRRKWNDTEKRTIESCLNSVVAGMLTLARAIKTEGTRKEQQAREEADRQRRLQLAAEEQKRLRAELAAERSRVDKLRQQANLWHEAENLRRFVEEAQRRGPSTDSPNARADLDKWTEWAVAQADRLDPFVKSPPSILDEAERIERLVDEVRVHR